MHSYKLLSVSSKKYTGLILASLLVLFFRALPANAVVNVEGTRVIFPPGETVSSVNLINSGQAPSVVQLWFDMGDINALPEESRMPLMALPPVFQLKPGELKDVRLQWVSASSVPAGREALYWLNIYQVPPNTAGETDDKRVVLPLRLRLKVFVRPSDITNPEEEDGKKLRFQLKTDGGITGLVVSNPTPWHMTMVDLMVGTERLEIPLLPPGEEQVIPLKNKDNNPLISYNLINDQGNKWHYTVQATSGQ